MRPRLISFEGGEGCGKSTQLGLLVQRLQSAGQTVVTLREPGGTEVGEVIRDLLKHHPAGHGMSAETELLLFAASRAELVRKRIVPALEAGQWVVCDRFLDSTTVYQGIARGLEAESVAAINRFAIAGHTPGLTLVLDTDPAEARERMRLRDGEKADRMESEPMDFYHRVAGGFRNLAAQNPDRIRLVPASGPVGEVAQSVLKEFRHAFPGVLD
ncbi:MAG: dTMP kinase [Candidatus Methylacidiphilales bacterium]|nr:dTMP kinase [Candidatus Methylacidiphilales bacterium]